MDVSIRRDQRNDARSGCFAAFRNIGDYVASDTRWSSSMRQALLVAPKSPESASGKAG